MRQKDKGKNSRKRTNTSFEDVRLHAMCGHKTHQKREGFFCGSKPSSVHLVLSRQKYSSYRDKSRKCFLFCHGTLRPQKPQGLSGTGQWKWGEEGDYNFIYLSIHCHHQNDSCIKIDSDESHFNVSVTVKDKITSQCPQTTNLFEGKRQPKWNRAFCLPA